MSIDEKGKVSPTVSSTHISEEKVARTEEVTIEADTSGIDERKLLRKLDLALIPWLSFLYLLSFLDRTSIGNARVSYSNLSAHFIGSKQTEL